MSLEQKLQESRDYMLFDFVSSAPNTEPGP